MKWYWIILIVVAYFIVGAIILCLIGRLLDFDFTSDDPVATTGVVVMWPVILTAAILYWIATFIGNCINRL